MRAILGIVFLVAVAFALSTNRRHVRWRVVGAAFGVQFAIALFAFVLPGGPAVLNALAQGVQSVIDYGRSGVEFVFGPLAAEFSIVTGVLPVIVFVSSLVAVLYYLKIMQLLVITIGGFLRLVIGVSRLEAMVASANIFVGMTESPLVIRPYLSALSRGQLFTVMGVGLSSVSGAILVGYAGLGIDLQYLLPAAFMAAPGGLMMAKLLVPDDPTHRLADMDDVTVSSFDPDGQSANVIDAAAAGAAAGLKIALNVGAMLLCFVGLLALFNGLLGWLGGLAGFDDLTLELILGYMGAPVMWLLGIPWDEAIIAGGLLGEKTVLNEFVAYTHLAPIVDELSPQSVVILTFALCGFANFAALAMVLGSLAEMVPARRHEVAKLGLRAVLCGTLSNLMSAALAGLLFSL